MQYKKNMGQFDILRMRLHNQSISHHVFDTPSGVVKSLGAVQAQDYLGSLWAIGLRMKTSSESAIEKAIIDGTIVRSWPMRGTLHFVAAEDLRWMLNLLAPRVIQRCAGLYKQAELDKKVFSRCRNLFTTALSGGRQLSRSDLYAVLEKSGISTGNQRGLHILGHLAQEGLLCFGSRNGKQQTFVLTDEWIPATEMLSSDEALSRLAINYFKSHGPATMHDFAWWSGLTINEVKRAIQMVKSHLVQEVFNGQDYWMSIELGEVKSTPGVYLLPVYDEYMVAYKDRSAAMDQGHIEKIKRLGNGIFSAQVIVNGRIAGTWKRTFIKDGTSIQTSLFAPLSKSNDRALITAARHYGKFMSMPVSLSVDFNKD
jgi:hypothetical protein